jgi:deazaflavin-dependent oxidoreductase (nitroreductase family)
MIPLDKALRIKIALKHLSSLNALVYRLSGGKLWNKWLGKYPIMILSVKGRKTGKTRNIPLIKVMKDEQPILVASMGGMPMNPTWYYNVASDEKVTIQIGKEKKYYLAKQVDEIEKNELWPIICSFYPDYKIYQDKTARNIPVFLCTLKTINQKWREWIDENIKRGCSPDEIYTILFNEGFNENNIQSEMGYRPKKNIINQTKIVPSTKENEIQNMVKKFKTTHKTIPSYTEVGFLKDKLNVHLVSKIRTFYNENQQHLKTEVVAGGYIETDSKQSASETIELTDDLRNEIHSSLLKKAESWSGIKLLPTYVYGIRIYNRGAKLNPHRDREETHIIGVIINIAQEVEQDWPLEIEDHQGKKHQLILKPGEIILYESALLDHGRPSPLEGKKFVNVFCHYMPHIS